MKNCIFCGSDGKLSNEHIFPAWLQAHLGIEKEKLEIAFYSEDPQTVRSLVYGSHLNGHVCQNCNNGWMSQLELAASPLLKEMLEGRVSRILTDDEIHSLGLWIFKTALTLHNANPYPQVIPEHHYHLAFERKAPAHCWISIAHLKDPLVQPAWIQDQNWLGAQLHFSGDELREKLKQTYRIIFGFGYFAARIIYFPLNLRLFPLEEGVQFIHPRYRNTPILWPPSRSVEDLWDLNSGMRILPPFSQLSIPSEELTDYE
ncbi:MAG: hypothetical protein HY862_13735 [Chloroflexi bacterium]|nr:hypothetical protein [Chloroflexota bacterium]